MDSILKNVQGAYLPLFAHSIYEIFTNAYDQVDFNDQLKLVKLLGTWRNPPEKTKPPFSSSVLGELEKFIRDRQQKSLPVFNVFYLIFLFFKNCQQPTSTPALSSTAPQSISIQQQIQALLSQKQAIALVNPLNMVNANQITVLGQVFLHFFIF